MKFLKKYRVLIIVLATFSSLSIYRLLHQKSLTPQLVHFNVAQQTFEQYHDQSQFESYKQQLSTYYLSGAYEQDVANICKTAEDHFSKIVPKNKDIIIFDIDDTTLYHYQWFDKFEFIWAHQPQRIKALEYKSDPPIMPVLELYNFLINKGFTTIFLSSRNAGSYEQTKKELTDAGYKNFKEIILMPDVLAFDRAIKTEDWKLQARKELAEKYTIIGNVGDREKDFVGGYSGYKVKLPNYLY